MPYQVHRKIMGWKLTSVQRRRNLVGILDLVHNSQQQQQRLQTQQEQAHRRSGSKSTIPGKLAPPKQVQYYNSAYSVTVVCNMSLLSFFYIDILTVYVNRYRMHCCVRDTVSECGAERSLPCQS